MDIYTDVKIILMTETIKYPDGMMGRAVKTATKGDEK